MLNFQTDYKNEAEKSFELDLQQQAGYEQSQDFDSVREKAAEDYVGETEDALLEYGESSLSQGKSLEDTLNFISQFPRYSKEMVKQVALEAKAVEQNNVETLASDEDFIDRREDSLTDLNYDDINTNTLLFQEFRNKWIEDTSAWSTAKSIGKRIIPIDFYLRSNVLQGEDTTVDMEELKGRRKAWMNDKIINMAPVDFKQFLDTLEKDFKDRDVDRMAVADMLDHITSQTPGAEGIFDVLDFTAVGAGAKWLLKTGNRAKVALNASRNMKASIATLKDMDVAGTPSYLSTVKSTSPNVTQEIALDLAEDESVQKAILKAKNIAVAEMPEEMKQGILESFVENESAKIKIGKNVLDISQYKLVKDEGGAYNVVATIGGGTEGTAPMSATAAARKAKLIQQQHPDAIVSLLDDGGNTFVNASFNLTNPRDLRKVGTGTTNWIKSALTRIVAGRENVPDLFHQMDVIAKRGEAGRREVLYSMYDNNIGRLGKADKEQFETIYQKGLGTKRGEGAWFNHDELAEMGANEKVVRAYDTWRAINDELFIANNAAYRNKLKTGNYRYFNINNEDFYGRFVTNIDKPSNSTFFDEVTGIKYTRKSMTSDMLAQLQKEGRQIVAVHPGCQNFKDPIAYRLVKAGNYTMQDIPEQVLNYLPGGRRYYKPGTLFLKMGRSTYDEGVETMLRPFVLRAGNNKKALDEYAAEINEIQKIVRDNKGNKKAINKALANRQNFKHFSNVTSSKDLKQYTFFDGKFDAEVLEDGASMYQYAGKHLMDDGEDLYTNSMETLLEQSGKTRWSQGWMRGNQLLDINDEFSEIVDASEASRRALNKMIYTNTYTEYNRVYANEFVNSFGKILDVDKISNMSNEQILREALKLIRKDPDVMKNKELKKLYDGAMTMKRHWDVMANQMTDWDRAVDNTMRGIANSLADKEVLERGSKVHQWIANSRLDKFSRGLAYHWYLGFGNVMQFIKQGSGALNVIALHPVHGMKAIAMYAPLRMALASENAATIAEIGAKVSKVTGMSADNFTEMVSFIKKSGTIGGQSTQVGLDARHLMNSNGLKKASTFFANEGEKLNLLVADAAAYLERGKEGFEKWAAYSDDLYVNMSKASESVLQHGFGKIPTHLIAQFTGYPTRMIEAITGKHFTGAQRARLGISQLALWGTSGTLGVSFEDNLTGWGVPEDVAGEIDKGIVTNLFNDAGWSFEAGPAFAELFNGVLSGEINISDEIAATGPLKGVVAAAYDIKKMLFPPVGDTTMEYAMGYMATQSQLPSAFKNAAKGYIAWTTGNYMNKKRQQVNYDRKFDKTEAVMIACGFKPVEGDVYNKWWRRSRDFEASAKELANGLIEAWDKVILDNMSEASMTEYTNLAKAVSELARKEDGLEKAVWMYTRKGIKELDSSQGERLLTNTRRRMGDTEARRFYDELPKYKQGEE